MSALDLLLLLMVLIWGGNFSVIKYALRDFPQAAFNASRLVLASLVFVGAIAVVRRRAAAGLGPTEKALTPAEWMRVAFLALVGTGLYQMLFLAGLARTSVANSSLIFGCTPIVVAIMASVAGHERLSAWRWTGAAFAFAGIYAIVGRRAALSTATLTGDALVFVAMLCWSTYSVVAQPLLRTHSAVVITGWSMIIGTAMYLLVAIGSILETNWGTISATSWTLMAASSLLALAFAYIVWYSGVQKIGSARTALYSNLTPIVAMTVGALWLGEHISGVQLLGTALILGGLAITRLQPA